METEARFRCTLSSMCFDYALCGASEVTWQIQPTPVQPEGTEI
jgi:hypothetical protein